MAPRGRRVSAQPGGAQAPLLPLPLYRALRLGETGKLQNQVPHGHRLPRCAGWAAAGYSDSQTLQKPAASGLGSASLPRPTRPGNQTSSRVLLCPPSQPWKKPSPRTEPEAETTRWRRQVPRGHRDARVTPGVQSSVSNQSDGRARVACLGRAGGNPWTHTCP